ncbi:MAG TPA: hypothetical protein PKX48_13790 [Planctomycetota bacterium]|nr:hypothetical protein [Planctomycetota bacterium]OQC21782.1 MAG: hypothetical protein BWX69_00713 [Planctomycetes bacterium ADurb.Bin069]HNS00733.1 hypothetical protein [Planctomycetota bacterium]HNU26360.1 hypothetical protein [Planctomycetota bacterium]HOE29752.1 hypothetical protein [Planctomycetota bacterium]
MRSASCALLAALVLSSGLTAAEGFAIGYHVADSPLIDVSGDYISEKLTGSDGSTLYFTFNLAHDAKGKITGEGIAVFQASETIEMDFRVAGSATSVRADPGTARVSLAFTRFKDRHTARRCAGSFKVVLPAASDLREVMSGTITGSLSVRGVGKLAVRNAPFDTQFRAGAPERADWRFVLTGTVDGKRLRGTAAITLSNLRVLDFVFSGSFSEAKGIASLTLKGTGAAKGTSLKCTFFIPPEDGLPNLWLKGKLLGQAIAIADLPPRLFASAECKDLYLVEPADSWECDAAAEYEANLKFEAKSSAGALFGGRLRLEGPDRVETADITADFCEGEDDCDVAEDAVRIRFDYDLYGPYSSWRLLFTVEDNTGFAISLELPIENPDVVTPKNGLILEVRQTTPMSLEGDDEVIVPVCVRVIDDNYALLGGALTIKGLAETQVVPFTDPPSTAGAYTNDINCLVRGPKSSWSIQFTAVNSLGARATKTLKVLNPRKKMTISLTQIGKAVLIVGPSTYYECALRLEVHDPDNALIGGTMLATTIHTEEWTIEEGICTELGASHCRCEAGLFWLVAENVHIPRHKPLKVTIINRNGKRVSASLTIRP